MQMLEETMYVVMIWKFPDQKKKVGLQMKATQLLNRRMKNIFYFDILLKLFLKEKKPAKNTSL